MTQGGAWSNEVAYNDDCGVTPGQSPLRSCFHFVAPATGTYCLAIYAKWPNSGGSGGHAYDLYWNRPGYPEQHLGRFDLGGYAVVKNIGSQETFETVLVNDGAAITVLLRLAYDGTHYRLSGFDYWSSVGYSSILSGVSALEKWIIATPYVSTRRGPVRALRNDVLLGDSDGDGLGNNLEGELCTCKSGSAGWVCGFNCGTVADARDTDGDGLRDDWEVRGFTDPSDANPQPLPLWGANPRHKDIFVEVDRAGWDPTQNPPIAPAFSTALATWAAQRYSVLKNQHNPDGVNGVNVHYDVDHDCETRDATHDGITSICGQMGGASIIPTGVGGGCTGSLKSTNMAAVRWGVFHWAGRQYGSSGYAGYGDSLCFGGPADENAAHEMGHNFGLLHHGADSASDVHRKPNYVSLMSYSYGYYNAATGEWLQEGNPDPHANFSDGSRAGVPLDPENLPELYAYPPSVDISGFCEEPYLYQCSGGSVDWNRDGLYSGGGIRAYIGTDTRARDWSGNDMPIIQGESRITGLTSTQGVGAATLPDIYGMPHVVVVGNQHGDYYMTRSAGGGWTAWTWLGNGFSTDSQPFAVKFQTDQGVRLFVFGASAADGAMWYMSISPDWSLSGWTRLPSPVGVTFKEASATDWVDYWGDHRLVVVARHRPLIPGASDVYYGYFHTWMDWNGWYPAQVGTTTIQSQISPAVANGPDGRYYMVVKAHNLDLYRPNALKLYAADVYAWMNLNNDVDATWKGDDAQREGGAPIDRPAMLYRAHYNAAGQPMARGALWLYYPVYKDAGSSNQHFRFTWGPFSATENNFGGNLSMGRFYHQGRWDTANYHGSALVENGLNTAAVLPPKTTAPGFMYYPYADGQVTPLSGRLINDFDDHATIRDNLCKTIRGCGDWCAATPPCQQQGLMSAPASAENLCWPPYGVAR